MNQLRRIVREVHRRSLWQVLSVYLVGSWGALQVVESITENAGLPDWVTPFALVLLVIGLPVVLATAVVQEGFSAGSGRDDGATVTEADPAVTARTAAPPADRDEPEHPGATDVPRSRNLAPGTGSLDLPSTRPSFLARNLTWRRAILGGVGAFALLGAAVAAYFVMRVTGVGPVASLAAQGVFDEGEPVILAEFANSSDDPSLGRTVTETLRIDLGSSPAISLVDASRIRETLARMEQPDDAVLTAGLAREVAVRDGIAAVVEGEVGSAGTGYILLATIREADSGYPLASFRRTADGPDGVVEAIDKLSQDIREKAGESLRSIRAEEPLEAVTTASLEALQKYAEAEELIDRGEYERALELLGETVEIDPDFAMAYRRLAVALQNAGHSMEEQQAAATRAYELREHLTDRERYLTEAYYHDLVTKDIDAEAGAYRRVLERHPDDQAALNNLAILFEFERHDPDSAIALLQRAVNGPGSSSAAHTNLPMYLATAGRREEALAAEARAEELYPDRRFWTEFARGDIAVYGKDWSRAHEEARALAELPRVPGTWRSYAFLLQATADAGRGHIGEADRHLDEALGDALREGRWENAVTVAAGAARLDHATARSGLARNRLRELLASGALDSIPPLALDHRLIVTALATVGLHDEARAILDAWAGAGLPTSSGTRIDETRRYAEAMARAADDPSGARTGLDALARDRSCPRCFLPERAGLARAAGDLQGAASLYEDVAKAISPDFIAGPVRMAPAHEALGEIREELGDTAKALEHYRRFVELWADADPELRPRVEAAQARIAALGG